MTTKVAACQHCPHASHVGMCGKRVEVNTFCGCFGRPRGESDLRRPTVEVQRAVSRIHECLAEVYLPDGVRMWLTSPNRNLGERIPALMIRSGRLSEVSAVLAEAERLSGGAW